MWCECLRTNEAQAVSCDSNKLLNTTSDLGVVWVVEQVEGSAAVRRHEEQWHVRMALRHHPQVTLWHARTLL